LITTLQDAVASTLVKEHPPRLCLPRLEAEFSGKLLLTGLVFFFSSTLRNA